MRGRYPHTLPLQFYSRLRTDRVHVSDPQKFPDAIKHPGFTWPTIPREHDIQDRIDFIFFRDRSPVFAESAPHMRVETVDAARVDPLVRPLHDDAESDVWQSGGGTRTHAPEAQMFSDHRGVFARLRFTWPVPDRRPKGRPSEEEAQGAIPFD